MVTSNNKTPDSVVKPLALIDLKHDNQNMKCLVTEWAKADEQIINQFVSLYLSGIDVYTALVCFLLTYHMCVHLRVSINRSMDQ